MSAAESIGREPLAHPALKQNGVGRFAASQSGRVWLLLLMATTLGCVSLILPRPWPALAPVVAGTTLFFLALLIYAIAARHRAHQRNLGDAIAAFIEFDSAPSLMVAADGTVMACNPAARERFGPQGDDATLAKMLRDLFANPSAILARLQTQAEARGAAREDVVTRRGHIRLSVHQVGGQDYVWRIEDISERNTPVRGAEALSLPMMTVGKTGTILFMNEASRRLLGGRVKSLDRVFTDLPIRSGAEHVIHSSDGQVRSRVIEVEGAAGRREIFLFPSAPGAELAPLRSGAADVFDAVPVAMMKLDADGVVLEINRLGRSLLGERAIPGARLGALLEGLGRPVSDWLTDAAAGRGLRSPETLRVIDPETETFVQVTLERMEDEGAPVLIAVLHDATELKTLEAQFVQSQKMQAIGQLAGGVAHDFNNLLTAISGHCDLLILRHPPDSPDYGDLLQINQNANRAASLVGQLLAFSRKQTLQMETVDLRDSMGELTHLLNRLVGEKVRLTLIHDPDLAPIRADKRQLEQVIMNLVVNARDAMPNGGEVRIETELRHFEAPFRRDRVEVPSGEYVIVRVTDGGVGIPPENLPKIFEPFFSTKRIGDGTGLGLSTAYGIVKQSGGYIFADSVIGSGTTFTLFFPAIEEEEVVTPVAPAPVPEDALHREEGVVLLVEDEAPVRTFASRALRLRGYTVIEAECAEDALTALEDVDLKVDVFVTDVIMPGMDGPSWVRKALEARPDAKVIFVSGYAEDSFSDAQACIPNSVFLPKPFSLNDLASTVYKQIH
ncbi:MAG: ATP-binding protein [Pseudomonadota bacterium]